MRTRIWYIIIILAVALYVIMALATGYKYMIIAGGIMLIWAMSGWIYWEGKYREAKERLKYIEFNYGNMITERREKCVK